MFQGNSKIISNRKLPENFYGNRMICRWNIFGVELLFVCSDLPDRIAAVVVYQ